MDALMELCRLEGIIPAIESAHAVAYAMKYARERKEAVGEKQAGKGDHGHLSVGPRRQGCQYDRRLSCRKRIFKLSRKVVRRGRI